MTSDRDTLYRPEPGPSSAWTAMKGIDPSAVAHAVHRLPLIQAVLAGLRADIACFHIGLRSRRRDYSCTVWCGDAERGYEIRDAGRDITHATLSEICGALAPLARDLSARWPERARPSRIGIASDGHRIVFNAEHPSCAGSDWLSGHMAGRTPLTLIADDGQSGALERICPL